MKINLIHAKGQRPEESVDLGEVGYLDFNATADSRRRHLGCLMHQRGIIHLDYDAAGFLVGMENVECDPFQSNEPVIDYLQPKDPRVKE